MAINALYVFVHCHKFCYVDGYPKLFVRSSNIYTRKRRRRFGFVLEFCLVRLFRLSGVPTLDITLSMFKTQVLTHGVPTLDVIRSMLKTSVLPWIPKDRSMKA